MSDYYEYTIIKVKNKAKKVKDRLWKIWRYTL
jgi:hypothetical protein